MFKFRSNLLPEVTSHQKYHLLVHSCQRMYQNTSEISALCLNPASGTTQSSTEARLAFSCFPVTALDSAIN